MEAESRRIYLDNHASTPCDPRVVEAMLPWWTERCGNAGSAHLFGWEVQEALGDAQTEVARLCGFEAREVIFTSGATEACNLAIFGVAARSRPEKRHMVTTVLEHPAVSGPLAKLESQGWEISRIGVDADGQVDAEAFIAALRDDTALANLIWANNEIGSIQPVARIGAACRKRGIPLHSDATQAVGRVPIDAEAAGVDLLSLSAHKFYGPKGIGALLARRRPPRPRLAAELIGGGQQDGMRPGTPPAPLIVGMGVAARLALAELESGNAHAAALRDRLWEALARDCAPIYLNGALEKRLAANLNVCIPGVEGQALLLELPGLAFSTGSACHSGGHEPSAILMAIGRSEAEAHCSIRLGVGRFTTEEEVDEAARLLAGVVHELRAKAPVHRAVSTLPKEEKA